MRRFVAVFAAVVLVGALAGSSVAASPTPRNTFYGDFEQVSTDGSGYVWGRITAQLFMPTDQRVVPGSYAGVFVADNPLGIRESHAQLGTVHFWHDAGHLGGANVAFASGVICDYVELNNAVCQRFAVQFVDVLDPTLPDEVAYSTQQLANGDWDFGPGSFWLLVGKGDFVLKFSGTES